MTKVCSFGKYFNDVCKEGDIESVKFLLNNHPFLKPGYNNNEALVTSIKNNHTGIVEMLLEDKRIDLSFQEKEIIMIASIYGNREILSILLKHTKIKAFHISDMEIRDICEITDPCIVILLLNSEKIKFYNSTYEYILIWGCDIGNIVIVKFLLKKVKYYPNNFKSLIELASKKGYINIVKMLLESDSEYSGSCLEKNNKYIELASQKGYIETVKLFLKTDTTDKNYIGALAEAVREGHDEIAEIFNTSIMLKNVVKHFITTDYSQDNLSMLLNKSRDICGFGYKLLLDDQRDRINTYGNFKLLIENMPYEF